MGLVDLVINAITNFFNSKRKINIDFKYAFYLLVAFFSFFTVTVCEKDSTSKQLNFLENKDLVFEKNAPSLMYLKKQLVQNNFDKEDVNKIVYDIAEAIGTSWYDQLGKVKVFYKLYNQKKYIIKVEIFAAGRIVKLNYESLLSNKTETSGTKNHLMLMKGVVSNSFSKMIVNNEEIPFILRKKLLQFYKEAHLNFIQGDRFYCLYDSKDCSVLSIMHSNNNGKKMIVYFPSKKGDKFFTTNGVSVVGKKFYFKKPVAGRIGSKFGYRFHPILKIYKFHYGLDFAAPPGTPIFPAAPGKVIFKGRKGSYGNVVILKHGHINTLYAHMRSFGKIEVGSFVDHSKSIGSVGSTGLSTGPHLHYEVSINGKKVNPLNFFQESHVRLEGDELKMFKDYVVRISKYFN